VISIAVPVGDETPTYLLELDGEEIVYEGGFVARFSVRKVSVTPQRPHGISYSLTLHGPDGRRLMGYDNAHGVPAAAAEKKLVLAGEVARHPYVSPRCEGWLGSVS